MVTLIREILITSLFSKFLGFFVWFAFPLLKSLENMWKYRIPTVLRVGFRRFHTFSKQIYPRGKDLLVFCRLQCFWSFWVWVFQFPGSPDLAPIKIQSIQYNPDNRANRYSAVKVLNSIKMGQRWRHKISGRQQPLGSHVKLNSLLQKTKMPGAPKLQSLSKVSIGQNNQLFMGNILATLDFFYFYWYFRLHVNRKKWMPHVFNMTLPFITFFQKCSRNIRLKIVGSLDFLYVLSRCRKCWPFSYSINTFTHI